MHLIKLKVYDYGNDCDNVWVDNHTILNLPLDIKKININSGRKGTVSHFHHDIFKKLTHVYYDVHTDSFFLPSDDLYNKRKLKALSKTSEFKNREFSFFDYSLVLRLLGIDAPKEGKDGLLR